MLVYFQSYFHCTVKPMKGMTNTRTPATPMDYFTTFCVFLLMLTLGKGKNQMHPCSSATLLTLLSFSLFYLRESCFCYLFTTVAFALGQEDTSSSDHERVKVISQSLKGALESVSLLGWKRCPPRKISIHVQSSWS